MENKSRKQAKAFLKEYGLSRVALGDLRRIITGQGYTIVEFNHICNNEHVRTLIEVLKLQDMVERVKGFTYADSQKRLVFLHEDLSEQEKTLVLAHEEGHIYCNHFCSTPILGRDVLEEYEANEFTHYILNTGISRKVSRAIQSIKKQYRILIAVFLALAIGCAVFVATQRTPSFCGDYYLTETGNKYHEEKCIFVKDKTTTRRMTEKEFESGDYTACGMCLPK